MARARPGSTDWLTIFWGQLARSRHREAPTQPWTKSDLRLFALNRTVRRFPTRPIPLENRWYQVQQIVALPPIATANAIGKRFGLGTAVESGTFRSLGLELLPLSAVVRTQQFPKEIDILDTRGDSNCFLILAFGEQSCSQMESRSGGVRHRYGNP
ncbi:MAG: hypothetical protein ACKN9U_05165, partial [Pirellulaceae bacterium]